MAIFAIEPITHRNFSHAWPLIRECLLFYGVDPHAVVEHRKFFFKLAKEDIGGVQHLCEMNETPVGFSTIYFTFSTFYGRPVAFLNDLYVKDCFRRQGVGSALLDNVRLVSRSRGVKIVQWLVSPENLLAQRFFEDLGTVKSSWIRHTWQL